MELWNASCPPGHDEQANNSLNPANDFGGFVYNAAGVFLAPFFGLTGSPSSGSVVLEVPSLIAMLVYFLIGWAIVRFVLPLFDQGATSSTSTYDRSRL